MTKQNKSSIKIARMIACDDTGRFRSGVFTWQGKELKGQVVNPYGLISCPPPNSMGVVLSQNAQESNAIAIVDDPNNRIKVAAGESGTANYITGGFNIHKEDGTYEVVSPTAITFRVGGVIMTIDSNGVSITGGTLTVDGTITSNDDVLAQAISLRTHTHGGVMSGGSNTGGPN